MKLEREVRHKSEDISDDVLSDTVKALGRRVRVSHDYDIPYIAGYSADVGPTHASPCDNTASYREGRGMPRRYEQQRLP